jgi:hypothetical protein
MGDTGNLPVEAQSAKSIRLGIHRPKKADLSKIQIDLDKYSDVPLNKIYLDPRPRIRNIVKELEEEHQWSWPPQPPKDYEKVIIINPRQNYIDLSSNPFLQKCN